MVVGSLAAATIRGRVFCPSFACKCAAELRGSHPATMIMMTMMTTSVAMMIGYASLRSGSTLHSSRSTTCTCTKPGVLLPPASFPRPLTTLLEERSSDRHQQMLDLKVPSGLPSTIPIIAYMEALTLAISCTAIADFDEPVPPNPKP